LSTNPNSGYRKYDAAEDNFIKNYSNQYDEVEVKWKDGATIQVNLEDGPNRFSS